MKIITIISRYDNKVYVSRKTKKLAVALEKFFDVQLMINYIIQPVGIRRPSVMAFGLFGW